jgi:hypothetical protein
MVMFIGGGWRVLGPDGLVGSLVFSSHLIFFLSGQKSSMERWPSPVFPAYMPLKHCRGQSHSRVLCIFAGHFCTCCSTVWLGVLQMWQQMYVGGHGHCSVECERMWHLSHCQNEVNCNAKLTLTRAPYMKVGLWIIAERFWPGSERRKVNAPILVSKSARVAFIHTGPSIGVHTLYGRLRPSSLHICLDVGSEPSGLCRMGTPWKTRWVWPLFGVSSNMLGPKGHSKASQYFKTVAIVGQPAKVIVKLEESGPHQRPARMVSLVVTSPSCWRMRVSIALMRV